MGLQTWGFRTFIDMHYKYQKWFQDEILTAKLNRKYGGCLNMETKKKTYKEVETEIIKFDKVGQFVEGTLEGVETGHNFGNDVYKIKTEAGRTVTVFSTTVLTSLMAGIKRGDKIKIEYTENKPNSNPKLNPIKIFKVYNVIEN